RQRRGAFAPFKQRRQKLRRLGLGVVQQRDGRFRCFRRGSGGQCADRGGTQCNGRIAERDLGQCVRAAFVSELAQGRDRRRPHGRVGAVIAAESGDRRRNRVDSPQTGRLDRGGRE